MLRSGIFWMNDWLHGSAIRRHLAELHLINENPDSDRANHLKRQHFNDLREHACASTRFYAAFQEASGLTDFPVINKNIIREDPQAFESSAFAPAQRHQVRTSGSTGTPFTIYQDRGKRRRHHADLLYFNSLIGFQFGTPLLYLRVWNNRNQLSPIKRFLSNIKPVDGSDLSIDATKLFLKTITALKQPSALLAYASTLEAHLKNMSQLDSRPIQSKLIAVITMSESFSCASRQALSNMLGCPVYSRYSNSENGIMAHQLTADNHYLINEASYLIEVLDLENDQPAPASTPGRIVITDLFNKATPLIRYDTGDVGVVNKTAWKGQSVHVLERIDGRRTDFIRSTTGTPISPAVVEFAAGYFDEIKQYQFIQNRRDNYTLKLNLFSPIDEEQILTALRTYLGEDAQIEFVYVDEIPLLGSGKRKQVINNYEPV